MQIENLIEEVFKPSKEEIEKNICLWLATDLFQLEEITGRNFYFSKEKYRKRRPFLSVHCYGETFAVVFLSGSAKGYQKKVDLTLCEKRNCKDFLFYEKSYLFQTRRGKYEAIFLSKFQIEELAQLCGCCKNLERIRKFCSQTEVEK